MNRHHKLDSAAIYIARAREKTTSILLTNTIHVIEKDIADIYRSIEQILIKLKKI